MMMNDDGLFSIGDSRPALGQPGFWIAYIGLLGGNAKRLKNMQTRFCHIGKLISPFWTLSSQVMTNIFIFPSSFFPKRNKKDWNVQTGKGAPCISINQNFYDYDTLKYWGLFFLSSPLLFDLQANWNLRLYYISEWVESIYCQLQWIIKQYCNSSW